MSKGGWSISQDLISNLKEILPNGSKILEFGSGYGTQMLIEAGYDMFSVEENPSFAGLFHNQYCLAEITDGWYNTEKVSSFLKGKSFDAILIDGPAHGERLKILDSNINFNDFKIIIVDDIERKEDAEVFSILSEGKNYKKTETYGVIFND